jgi:hypothetical protein
MPMALQAQRNEGVKISKANPRCMVSNTTTSTETSADDTTRHAFIRTLEKIGFEGDKWQFREWMTVGRDGSAWALKVEYKLDFSPGSFASLRQMIIDKIGLDRRFTARKQTTRVPNTLRSCHSYSTVPCSTRYRLSHMSQVSAVLFSAWRYYSNNRVSAALLSTAALLATPSSLARLQ